MSETVRSDLRGRVRWVTLGNPERKNALDRAAMAALGDSLRTLSLANMLSELRKYRLSMILAQQYISQVDEEIRDAILADVGTIVSFRAGPEDAEIPAKELYPKFSVSDLMSLRTTRST